jgi:diguanylate cyclase (GGDEF)-like protein/PAS domain S-box-containing protein
VVVRDLAGLVTAWNRGAERLYGFSAEEMMGRTYDSIVPEARRAREAVAANAAALLGMQDTFETERVRSDGSLSDVTIHLSPVRDASGATVGVSTMEHEPLPRQGSGSPAAVGERYLWDAFEEAPIAMAVVAAQPDSAGRFLHVNRAFCSLTGYGARDLQGADVGTLVHRDDLATDLAAMTRLQDAELNCFQLEQRLLHAQRHVVWVNVSVSLVRDIDGAPLYCLRQVQDIAERRRYEGELGYLVEHDPLTGLLNRRGFVRELAHEMAYSRRYGAEGAVLFIDLDDLKWVNDTLGHMAGDEVISEVARILGERLRETDALARFGGDEFSVLLPHTSAREAEAMSNSLIGAVAEGCAVALPGGRRLTLSIGVNTFDAPGEHVTPDDVIVDADRAMYAAKEAGKNRVALASRETHERAMTRVSWAERVRRAVEQGLFELFCQPIVDFASDDVSQWELLLRLPGDDGELILPAQFLYTAERSDLILEIDRWVLGEAMRLIADQEEAGRDVRLEVNLSGRSVGDPQILEFIEEGLGRTGIAPASLVLEVTETAAIANIDRARGFASRLQTLGCRFALDDFGAGFGSFYYLKHIPFDYVKIDGEFIRNLPASKTDQLILDSIVQMSRGLGKHTIAEYVEDGETVEVLKQHGVDYGQGFHLGKPAPVSAVLRM